MHQLKLISSTMNKLRDKLYWSETDRLLYSLRLMISQCYVDVNWTKKCEN